MAHDEGLGLVSRKMRLGVSLAYKDKKANLCVEICCWAKCSVSDECESTGEKPPNSMRNRAQHRSYVGLAGNRRVTGLEEGG